MRFLVFLLLCSNLFSIVDKGKFGTQDLSFQKESREEELTEGDYEKAGDTYSYAYLLIFLREEKNEELRKEIIERIKRNLKIEEKEPEDYAEIAEVYAEAGIELEKAEEMALKSVRKRPDFYSHYVLARVYLEEGKLKDAEEFFKKSLAQNPSHPWTYFYLGEVYERMGKIEKAKKIWKKGLKYNPKHWLMNLKIKENR